MLAMIRTATVSMITICQPKLGMSEANQSLSGRLHLGSTIMYTYAHIVCTNRLTECILTMVLCISERSECVAVAMQGYSELGHTSPGTACCSILFCTESCLFERSCVTAACEAVVLQQFVLH